MECGQHYNEDFGYQWEKENKTVYLNANSYQLNITDLKVEDAGEYRCAMSNSTGKIFSDYLLITIKGLLNVTIILQCIDNNYTYTYNSLNITNTYV